MTEDEELELLQLQKEKALSGRMQPQEGFTVGKIIPEAISNVESLGRGGVASTVAGIPSLAGIPGTIESFGRAGLRKLGANVQEQTVLPTMGEIYEPIAKTVKEKLPRITQPTTEAAGFEQVGEVVGAPVSPKTLVQAGKKVASTADVLRTGMGGVKDILRAPKPIGDPSGYVAMGEKLESKVKQAAKSVYEPRAKEAEVLYNSAKDAARIRQAQGEPFARSDAGRALLNSLENEKRIIAGREAFEVGQDKIAAIDRLINAIKGTTTGGEIKAVGKGKVSGRLQTKTPTKTTEKDVDAIVEELRFLREVNKPGKQNLLDTKH